jgi:hypothetical protein
MVCMESPMDRFFGSIVPWAEPPAAGAGLEQPENRMAETKTAAAVHITLFLFVILNLQKNVS